MRRRLGFLAEPYRRQPSRRLASAATALTGAGALGIVLAGRRRSGAIGAGALMLAGALARRFAVFRAGFASARDPRYTIASQRRPPAQQAPEAAETDTSIATRHAATGRTRVGAGPE